MRSCSAAAPGAREQLKGYPLDVVHVNEDADVDTYLAEPEVDYVEALARELGPSIVLVPNTMHGATSAAASRPA